MHRRKSSRDEDDNVLIFPIDEPSAPILQAPPPPVNGKHANSYSHQDEAIQRDSTKLVKLENSDKPSGNGQNGQNGQNGWTERSRVVSNPSVPSVHHGSLPTSYSHPPHPPSSGPYRTSFASPWPAHANGVYSYGRHQPPAMRQSLSLPSQSSHARTRSVSGPFSPITPSPLSSSFPVSQTTSHMSHQSSMSNTSDVSIKSSATAPELHPSHSPPKPRFPINNGLPAPPGVSSAQNIHRHSRIHSRNLSVYFPHPGSISATSIDEDDAQEVNFSSSSSLGRTPSDDGIPMPSASPGPGQRSFREGFTFGARPSEIDSPLSSGALRRGHHHKHSLSHNIFSFLEPGSGSEELHTTPTLTPVSPWNPISPWPSEKEISRFGRPSPVESSNGHVHEHAHEFMTGEKTPTPIGGVRAPPEIDTPPPSPEPYRSAVLHRPHAHVVSFRMSSSLSSLGTCISSVTTSD